MCQRDIELTELPLKERVELAAARRRAVEVDALVMADLTAKCPHPYPEVREDPRELLSYNWRARARGVAASNVAHFR